MTCTDPEYGISALVSQASFYGGNKWCHREMSVISGLSTPFQPPPSARETRVTLKGPWEGEK